MAERDVTVCRLPKERPVSQPDGEIEAHLYVVPTHRRRSAERKFGKMVLEAREYPKHPLLDEIDFCRQACGSHKSSNEIDRSFEA